MKEKVTLEMSDLEDEATLYSLATEFLAAAKMLDVSNPDRVGYDVVVRYLLGHASELFLKSYLARMRVATVDELSRRPYGHDLEKLVSASIDNGLSCECKYISELSDSYKAKSLEYRQRKEAGFPGRADLISDVERLAYASFAGVSLC